MSEGGNHGNDGVSFPCQEEKMAALSRMSSSMSHKVSNSLTYVLNYIFILKSSITDEKGLSMLKKMEKGILKAKEVLQEITDISNPVVETLSVVDVKACIDEGMSRVIDDISKKGVVVEVESSGPAKVMASWRGLIKILMILMENSVEAGASKIKISTEASDESLELSVEDNGSGIQEENLGLIFEPFFTTKPSAAGLGLYVLYHSVQSFGGHIKFRPSKTGGAFFQIIFDKKFQV